jgi:hypothetical protein
MGLNIPTNAICLLPGCTNEPTHLLSLRMRRRDSGADWAPNTEAYFCADHATKGAQVVVLYCPTATGEVEIDVSAAFTARSVTRTTPITRV